VSSAYIHIYSGAHRIIGSVNQPALDYGAFDALTFDCYGTLIDWETGLVAAFADALGPGHDADDLLERYARHEVEAETGPYLRYRSVLAHGLRGVARELGLTVTDEAVERFGASVADWPPFPDSSDALRRLATRFRLGVLTNCDDDLFAASNARLGVAFDWIVTAQQIGAYKPAEANFRARLERVGANGVSPDRVLHVAQSLYHDHVPAQRLGLHTVWIDRRHDRPGAGATPVADVTPDATFPSMASLAEAAIKP
jgi:2-haloalkanoic acid dehalogenase type II